jgi:membrane-bound lytic murein transglycosylase D
MDEMMALNPSVLRMATPPDAAFDLHLPAGTATLFTQRIAAIPEARRNAWRYHSVAAQDTLASVAREFHLTEAALASANQLRAGDSLQGVEGLAVPQAPAAAVSANIVLYTARRGDTLVTIADRFGVSLNELRRWNGITGIKVAPGRRLHVAEPASEPQASSAHRREAHARSVAPAATAPAKATARSTTKRSAPQNSAAKKKPSTKNQKQAR